MAEELDDSDFFSTVRKVLAVIDGSYSLVFMHDADPDTIICTKKDNPLIIGLGEDENFIASDIPAVINYTRRIYILNDGEIAVVKKTVFPCSVLTVFLFQKSTGSYLVGGSGGKGRI